MSSFPNLQILDLSRNEILDIGDVSHFKKLSELQLMNNKITVIDRLLDLPALTNLNICTFYIS